MTSAPTPLTRRVLALAAAGVLALGACGSDGDGSSDGDGADTQAFCAQLGELIEGDGSNAEAGLRDLAASAPEGVADDMAAFVDLFVAMSALDAEGSEEAQAELADRIGDFDDLAGRLDTWTNENCPDLPRNAFTEG